MSLYSGRPPTAPRRRFPILVLTTMLLLVARPAMAQNASGAAPLRVVPVDSAVAACVVAVEGGRTGDATRLASAAEERFRARLAVAPTDVDAHVALASTLLRCRVPFADLPTRGQLSADAVDLLQRALELEPQHWTARFTLASTYARLPAFMGRARDAARQLDTLLGQQGARVQPSVFARSWELRGDLWARERQADSARATWQRGAALFPADSGLARRLRPQLPAAGDTAGARARRPPGAEQPEMKARPVERPAPAGSPPATVRPVGTLESVRVVARVPSVQAATPGVVALGRGQVQVTPGGMADVLLNVNLQPGATRAGEGSDVYTRGGDPSETPVFLDGGRMLAISRFEGLNGGLFGALDPTVLRSARLLTGGFGAQWGNALSGVLDLVTEGRTRERRSRLGVSMVQVATTQRQPLGASRASVWGSIRGMHTGALLGLYGRGDEYAAAPWSVDAVGGIVAEPRPGTELRADVLYETDASTRRLDAGGYVGPFQSTGGSRLLVLAGRTVLPNAPVMLRANVSASRRSTGFAFGVLDRDRREASTVTRIDAEWVAASMATVRTGVEGASLRRTENGRVPLTPRLEPAAPSTLIPEGGHSARHLGGYAELSLAVGPEVTLDLGARADRLPGEDAPTFDPRAVLAWQRGAWTVRAAGGVCHQGRWRALTPILNGGLPTQVATRATHLVAGLEHQGALRWRVEAFHKDYGRYLPAAGAASAAAAGSATAGPPATAGTADGAELFAQLSSVGRLQGWVGYSLLRARLDLADGRRVSASSDVTHSLTGVTTADLGNGWSLGTTARYGTGVPYTPVVGTRVVAEGPAAGSTVPIYGATLASRLPDYVRLDARLMRSFGSAAGLVTTYVEALNLAARANVANITYDAEFREHRYVPTFFSSRMVVVGAELQLR